MVILERSGGERPSITGGLCFNFFRTKQNETRKQQTLGFTLKVFYISQITITLFVYKVPHSWNSVVHTHSTSKN